MKACTVWLTLRHLFLRSSGHWVTEIAKLFNKFERYNWTSGLTQRLYKTNQGVDGRFFLLFKCVRNVIEKAVSICVIILQDRKVKKFNFTISKFRAQRYEDIWPTKVGKPWREKGGAHADMVPEGFENFIAKDDLPANSRDVNPLETIWIISDETTYKDPAPKTQDELRMWLRFARKNVPSDTLLELIHSGYLYFSYSKLNE